MMPTDWRELHKMLAQCPWFTKVGQWTDSEPNKAVRQAKSWNEAMKWTEASISWWCVNEAANVLREFLHTHHNREYQEWNRHIESFGFALDELIASPVTAALPPEVCTPGVKEWIRSHFISAYLECIYSPLSDVRLVCNQIEWYLAGHFPCGWFVEKESGFPDLAVTVVY